jgi:hypothetical protein
MMMVSLKVHDKAVALMRETQGLVWGATPNASPETWPPRSRERTPAGTPHRASRHTRIRTRHYPEETMTTEHSGRWWQRKPKP